MADHPIQGIMDSAMENIKQMVDVNTIIGDAVETPDGTIIIPVSRVSFGFGSGGSEFNSNESKDSDSVSNPFGGGCAGGVTIHPVAFLIVGKDGVKLMPIEHGSNVDRILDLVPDVISKINDAVKGKINIRNRYRKGNTDKSSEKSSDKSGKSDNKSSQE